MSASAETKVIRVLGEEFAWIALFRKTCFGCQQSFKSDRIDDINTYTNTVPTLASHVVDIKVQRATNSMLEKFPRERLTLLPLFPIKKIIHNFCYESKL